MHLFITYQTNIERKSFKINALFFIMIISSGSKWHSRRKLLTPAFHFSILEQFVPVFCEQTHILIKNLRDVTISNPEGFDVVPFVTKCALDIICGKNNSFMDS
jgi:cytochrome P450